MGKMSPQEAESILNEAAEEIVAFAKELLKPGILEGIVRGTPQDDPMVLDVSRDLLRKAATQKAITDDGLTPEAQMIAATLVALFAEALSLTEDVHVPEDKHLSEETLQALQVLHDRLVPRQLPRRVRVIFIIPGD